MSNFAEWFEERMNDINYHQTGQLENDECTWMQFADNSNTSRMFHVFYVKKPLTEAIIRTTFAMKNEPVLFVVDSRLMDYEKALNNFDALRTLHAIYYGRIYVWDRGAISAVHFDWNTKKYSALIVDVTGILFDHTDCQLKSFPGYFYIARFYDPAFWKQEQPKQKKQPDEGWKERAKKQREEWEQATKDHYERQNHNNPNYSNKDSDYEGDVYEAFKQAFREHMRSRGVDYDTPRQRYTPQGDKWFEGFMSTGNLHTAKAMYKALAKEWHPDINKSPEAETNMKAINAAWDKVQRYLT